MDTHTTFEKLTHEGRKICEREDLAGGYCGSISLEGHIEQLSNPESWVHSSKSRWLKRVSENMRCDILEAGAGI